MLLKISVCLALIVLCLPMVAPAFAQEEVPAGGQVTEEQGQGEEGEAANLPGFDPGLTVLYLIFWMIVWGAIIKVLDSFPIFQKGRRDKRR